MAVPLYSPGSTSYPRAPLSCASKVFFGIKSQSASLCANKRANLSADFYDQVSKGLNLRGSNNRPTRGRISMMCFGPSRVDAENALYRERVIFLGQYIDEDCSDQLVATMLYLDTIDDSRGIRFYIHGPGGDLAPSMLVYDTMQSLKHPLRTLCFGHASTFGTYVLSAGEKGHRLTMPISRIEVLPPAGAARGKADDINNEANELLRIRNYLYKELAQNSGQPVEKIHQDMSRGGLYLDSQEAVAYGLVDRIARPPLLKDDDVL